MASNGRILTTYSEEQLRSVGLQAEILQSRKRQRVTWQQFCRVTSCYVYGASWHQLNLPQNRMTAWYLA